MQEDYIIEKEICQEETPDKEIKEKFEPKKTLSHLLYKSYKRLGEKSRADNVKRCGSFLEFAKTLGNDSVGVPAGNPVGVSPDTGTSKAFKLYDANFCRDRLCPMCSWRRSLKIFNQVSQIMNVIEGKYRFIFLTLTVRNCSGSDLPKVITRMQTAWSKGIRYNKRFKKAVKGYFKALEVTHNLQKYLCKYIKDEKGNKKAVKLVDENGHLIPNLSYDTYHPHFHCILAVDESYFNKRFPDYIKQSEWLEMWRNAYGDRTITQVDVRTCKPKNSKDITDATHAIEILDNVANSYKTKSISSAVAEVAKYTVKSSSYLGWFDNDNNLHTYPNSVVDSSVSVLSSSLARRRLCDFGGVFKEAREQLQLDDCENGDLIHVSGKLRSDVALMIYRYRWSAGAYKLLKIEKCVPNSELFIESDEFECTLNIDPVTGEVLS